MDHIHLAAIATPLPSSPPPKNKELPELVSTNTDDLTTRKMENANTDNSGSTDKAGNTVQNSSDPLQTELKTQEPSPSSETSSSSSATSTSTMPPPSSSTRTSLTDDSSHSQLTSFSSSTTVIKKGILLIRPSPISRSASSPPSVSSHTSSSTTNAPTATSVSTPPTPSITFAPLPTPDPRRRTSSVQLGVAARSQMLRARRMRLIAMGGVEGYNPNGGNEGKGGLISEMGGMLGGPIPGLDGYHGMQHVPGEVQYAMMREGEGYPRGMRGGQQRKVYAWADDEEDEFAHPNCTPSTSSRKPSTAKFGVGSGGNGNGDEDEEDAFVALGRLVRGGAKSLWRSLSVGNLREKEKRAGEGETHKQKEKESEKMEENTRNLGGSDCGHASAEDVSERASKPMARRAATEPQSQKSASSPDLVQTEQRQESVTVRVLVNEPKHLFEAKGSPPLSSSPTSTPTAQQFHPHSSSTSSQTSHSEKQQIEQIEKEDHSEQDGYDVADAQEVEDDEEEEEEEGKVWVETVDDNALRRRIERAQNGGFGGTAAKEEQKVKSGLGRFPSLRISGRSGRRDRVDVAVR